MSELREILEILSNDNVHKVVLSNTKNSDIKKTEITRLPSSFQGAQYKGKQVFHTSVDIDDFVSYVEEELLACGFKQINAWSSTMEYNVRISKKGKILFSKNSSTTAPKAASAHNREKNYIFREGMNIPPLVDMGIFTSEGKVVSSMYNKFKQINRFIELVDDEISGYQTQDILNVVDFGCGKSYLTFLLYYYFTEIKKIQVRIIGMDLKEDVVANCNIAAEKYDYTNLHFICGDIKDFKENLDINMVITLHACDTATDYALFHAIAMKADIIFSVPCCQHEINAQISTDNDFALLLKYGLLKERFSALLTDAIRANLLEAKGYRTQIVEFIDMEHTPKNIMLRAHKANISKEKKHAALQDVEGTIEKFKIQPTLYSLLYGE